MDELIRQLHEGYYSCVIANGTDVRTFTQRGVADLYDLLQHAPDFLHGALIADKVVGKGAAALMVLGGIKQVYADVISESALQLLMDAGVKTGYGKTVSHIINRTHTDWCPIEKATRDLATPQEILPAITEFLNQQRR